MLQQHIARRTWKQTCWRGIHNNFQTAHFEHLYWSTIKYWCKNDTYLTIACIHKDIQISTSFQNFTRWSPTNWNAIMQPSCPSIHSRTSLFQTHGPMGSSGCSSPVSRQRSCQDSPPWVAVWRPNSDHTYGQTQNKATAMLQYRVCVCVCVCMCVCVCGVCACVTYAVVSQSTYIVPSPRMLTYLSNTSSRNKKGCSVI